MGFEQLEHTADVGLHVWAPGLDGLFAEAALALFSVMGEAAGGPQRLEAVRLEAPDLEALFVDWLSELLYLFEAKELVPVDVSVRVLEAPWRLEGDVAGPPSLVQRGPAVKAVTYHRLRIEQGPGGAEAWVYLDI